MKSDSIIRIFIVIAFAVVMTRLLGLATEERAVFDRIDRSVENLVYLDVAFDHALVRARFGLHKADDQAVGRVQAMQRVSQSLLQNSDHALPSHETLNRAILGLRDGVQKKAELWRQFSAAKNAGQATLADRYVQRLIDLPIYPLVSRVRQASQDLVDQQVKEATWNRFLLYFSSMVLLSLLFYLMYLQHRTERQQQRMMRAVEATADAIVLTNADGLIAYINPAFTALTGWTPGEVAGRKQGILGCDQTDEQCQKMLAVLAAGKEWRDTSLKRKKPKPGAKEGLPYWCQETIAPVRDSKGKTDGFIHVYHDITELKEIQGQLQAAKQMADAASQAKSDFLANMSHEIRTPMNAIMGMTALCLHTETTPKQRDYLEKIDVSSRSLLRIINDILDFSKIEVNRLEMEHVPFNLENVLNSLTAIVSLRAQEKGLELLINADMALPMTLRGDPMRLEQVLINLANNAVKFTESGEVLVMAELVDETEGEATVRFSVRDTGVGMSGEQIGRLFQTFSQGDASTTRKYGGTGLGLAISQRLVRMMGGDICVQSVVGEGSIFSFSATFGKADDAGSGAQPFAPSLDLSGMSVLVIDDNRSALEILRPMLESFSFEVTTVQSGAAGLQTIEEAERNDHPFNLVITDWKMPHMDGLETAVRILAHTGISQIPRIIMMTAFDDQEVRKQADNCQLDGFLSKPVSQSVLFDTIMRVFGEKGSQRSGPLQGQHRKRQRGKSLVAVAGTTVLLVEDNAINQQVAKELLELAHFSVTVAWDGKQAVEAVAQATFDVVLMDLQMPGMDGHEATQHIRENPAFDALPIIAMTADALVGEKERCIASGMNDYVTKPIDVNKLFLTLAQWLPGKLLEVDPAVAKGSSEAAGRDLPLPDIPGIDMTLGLQKLGGNQHIYRNLLVKFSENHHRAGGELRAFFGYRSHWRCQTFAPQHQGAGGQCGCHRFTKGQHGIGGGAESGKRGVAC